MAPRVQIIETGARSDHDRSVRLIFVNAADGGRDAHRPGGWPNESLRQLISGIRRWAIASSNSPRSSTSAPNSRVRFRNLVAGSRFRSMAAWLSNVPDDTARPDERLINRRALQNPSTFCITG